MFLKRLAFFVFLAALLARPAFAQAPAPQAAGPDDAAAVRVTLANGMRVIVLPNKLAPVATTILEYGVGSDDDTQPGIAHATEHMLFRGTPSLSGGQLADVAARMGAEYNALTGNENTLFYYKMPAAYVDVALRIEADRMTHATIAAADWATEKGAIEQEVRALASSPASKVGRKLRQLFFKGTPFATAGPGTPESFEHMTADDIRAFYHRWYQPGNATLIVVGDVDPSRTLASVRERFESVPSAPLPDRAPIEIPALASATISTSIDFPIGFSALAYRLPGSNDPDYAASQVLGEVFKGGRNALADLMLTGKVLIAFNIASSYPEMGADFLAAIPASGASPESAAPLLMGVLDTYRSNGVPADLIEAAKVRLLAEQAFSRSSISGLGFAWATALEIHKTDPAAMYDEIAAVTPADVDRVLQTYLTPAHQISIVIAAKPTGASPNVDPSAAGEHVGFTPTMHEALPAWAALALKAPLRAPIENGTTVLHLPNGLQYEVRHESVAPTVTLHGYIRTDSSLYEPPGKEGTSLLLQEMLGRGNLTYDRKEYEAQLDAIGAKAKLGTAFSLEVRSKDFERGVELLADGMLHPAFPSAAFDVAKKADVQAIGVTNALPKTKADLAQRLALYPPGDPRRRDVTTRSMSAIRLDDVERYYRFAYRPDETSIAVVGDVPPARVSAALSQYFGAWHASGPKPAFQYPKLHANADAGKTVTMKSTAMTQADVTLREIWRMDRDDPDYVPLQLANTILSGEGTGSLLFEELRTRRGYVYSPESSFTVDADGAEFSLSFSSDPDKVRPATAVVVAIVKRLQTHPLPVVELQRAKALLLAQRVLPLDSYSGVAEDLLSGPQAGYGFQSSESAFWSALVTTTPAQLQRAMRRIDTARFVRLVVEP